MLWVSCPQELSQAMGSNCAAPGKSESVARAVGEHAAREPPAEPSVPVLEPARVLKLPGCWQWLAGGLAPKLEASIAPALKLAGQALAQKYPESEQRFLTEKRAGVLMPASE